MFVAVIHDTRKDQEYIKIIKKMALWIGKWTFSSGDNTVDVSF